MKHVLTQFLVGNMSLKQRALSVAAGVSLALIVIFAGSAFQTGTEAVTPGELKYYEYEHLPGWCSDPVETSCGMMFSCLDECQDDDDCCPETVKKEYDGVCMYGCDP